MDGAGDQLVRTELVRLQEEARVSIRRGVVLIAVVPVVLIASAIAATVVGGFGAFLSLLAAATYMLIGSIAGMASIAGGVAEHRRSARKLRELDARRQLPPARLVVR